MSSKLLISFFVFLVLITAQWPSSPDEPGVYIGSGSGGHYSISDNKGGFWITFLEYNNSLPFGLGLGIWHVDKFGYLSWDDAVYPFRTITSPDTLWLLTGGPIVNDGSGGVFTSYSLAIFNSINSDPLDFLETIYLQHIDSLGNKLWGEAGIQVTIPESFQYGISYWWIGESDLIYDRNGGVYILWTDWRHGTAPTIYGQHYNQYGVGLWDSTGSRLLYSDTNAILINGVKDGSGGVIYKVKPWISSSGNHKIQRVSQNGNLLWGDSGICISDSIHQWGWGELFSDNNGGAILVERLIRHISDSTNDVHEFTYNINRVNEVGDFSWGTNGVSVGDYREGAIDLLSTVHSNGAISYAFGSFNNRRLNRISTDGVKRFENNIEIDSLRWIDILYSDDYCVFLSGWRDSITSPVIQRFDSNGVSLFTGDGIPFSRGKLITDMHGGAIGVSKGNCRQISVNGNLGEVLLSINDNHTPFPKTIKIFQNFPNPFNPVTIIPFYIDTQSPIEIKIYDINGSEIFQDKILHCQSGYNEYKWNGKSSRNLDVSTGIYFIKIIAPGNVNKVISAIKIK